MGAMQTEPIVTLLEERRIREGISKAELARRLHCDPSYLFLLSKGRRNAGRAFLEDVIRVFPDLTNAIRSIVGSTTPVA